MAALSLKTEPKGRLYSLDTLRGFDMFWIIGGEALIIAFAKASGWDWLDKLATQMHHVEWNGFHFYDLIFPLFMFISGVAIPFALTSKLKKGVNCSLMLTVAISSSGRKLLLASLASECTYPGDISL